MGVTRVTELYAEVILDNTPNLSKTRVTELYAEVILATNAPTVSTLTRGIRIDLNDDGDYDDANEDVTNYVYEGRVESAGVDPESGEPIIAEMRLTLRNHDGRFSQTNAASPLYPNLQRGRRIKYTASYLGTLRNRFQGIIVDIIEDPSRAGHSVELICQDPLIKMREDPVAGRDWQSVNLKTIIENAVDDGGWTGTKNVDVTGDAPPFVEIPAGEDALSVLASIAETEGGRFYATPDLVFRWEERHYRRRAEQSLYDTYTNDWRWIRPEDAVKDNVTAVKVNVAPLHAGPLQEVWSEQKGGYVVKKNNASRPVFAEFEQQIINVQTPSAANADIAAQFTDGSGDASGSLTIAKEVKGRRCKITLTNTHATKDLRVTHLRLRGQPIETMEQYVGTAIASAEQAARSAKGIRTSVEASDGATGLGTIPKEFSPIYSSSTTYAESMATELLTRQKVKRKKFTFELVGTNSDRIRSMLGLDISKRVRLVQSAPMGLDMHVWVNRWIETFRKDKAWSLEVEAIEVEANQTVWLLSRQALSASPALVAF